LNDLGHIDPMYQFALDAYISLFNISLEKSKRSHKLEERIANLNNYHTYAVYKIVHIVCFVTEDWQENCNEWQENCNEFQKMLIVRSLRQDRVSFCVASFICKNLGSRFVEPPVLDMKAVCFESTCRTPLIFVLSPGVDPTGALLQLAESSGKSSQFHVLSLGQGQAPIAKRMITDGVKNGHWVFLANCHLSLSWMPELDKLVEQLQVEEPHPDFRLWLSSSPHPEFPITILQAGIKMTTEPPKGVKANMKRLYQLVTEAQFSHCSRPAFYRKLLFSLCFFHSILLERKKFLQLGWNIVYGFNDSDFEVSESLLSLYLDKYEEIPWDTLKYLIAGVNYGGHVTDDWDRRLLTTYINDYFCEAAVGDLFRVKGILNKEGYHSIFNLPATEHPEVFGQHPNADIASQIAETRTLFDTLLSLQPQVSSTGAGTSMTRGSREDRRCTHNAINLMKILFCFSSSIIKLQKGIKGVVVMSPHLEETFNCIYDVRVPPLWEKAYPSIKPLAAWTRDLCQRVAQFASWAGTTVPPTLIWLPGFTFPNSFLTAVLQSAARQHNFSPDKKGAKLLLPPNKTHMSNNINQPNMFPPVCPEDGVYIRGLYLEGAGWDKTNSCLVEAEPMQMVCPIPTIHFKPVERRKKMAKSESPDLPQTPVQTRNSLELKSGSAPADHWIKRGTALLLSLDS
uniref:Dynein axonemal heavy chain 2 n=1 Tax=Periophthalmus magnuspinnatus TaxID=409849 RepID=A0A3B4AHB3_9GOBI